MIGGRCPICGKIVGSIRIHQRKNPECGGKAAPAFNTLRATPASEREYNERSRDKFASTLRELHRKGKRPKK